MKHFLIKKIILLLLVLKINAQMIAIKPINKKTKKTKKNLNKQNKGEFLRVIQVYCFYDVKPDKEKAKI